MTGTQDHGQQCGRPPHQPECWLPGVAQPVLAPKARVVYHPGGQMGTPVGRGGSYRIILRIRSVSSAASRLHTVPKEFPRQRRQLNWSSLPINRVRTSRLVFLGRRDLAVTRGAATNL